jgi:hypothetical protein|nr:MAG: hypothetical protein [Bacteriophage sp.]
MAVVNVDLSEYDAIRKRNSELEEQVKELKKLNESLKSGSKVILRKEIVVERNVDVPTYDHITGLPTYKQRMCRDVVESSESYVNFEDVRLKVEQAMQDEVNRSINDRNQEKQAYAEMKNKLVNEQVGMKSNLQKEYEKKAKDLEEEYHRKECDFESEKLRILNLLPKINKLSTELHDDLVKRFFMPKHAVELAESIINTTEN